MRTQVKLKQKVPVRIQGYKLSTQYHICIYIYIYLGFNSGEESPIARKYLICDGHLVFEVCIVTNLKQNPGN